MLAETDPRIAIASKQLELQERGLQLQERQYEGAIAQSESRWNLITLGVGLSVFAIYALPPLSGALQATWKATVKVGEAVQQTAKAVDQTVDMFAPDLQRSPQLGEKIAGYPVTSTFGPREAPCPGCSTFHRGVDLGTPTGTPLYLIGKRGQVIDVKCWWDEGGGNVATFASMGATWQYLHLDKCASGKQKVGSVIARSGATGRGSGPHLHIEMKDSSGEKVPPPKWAAWAALTGELPQPVIVRGKDASDRPN